MLRTIKRFLFEKIRQHKLTRIIQDLDNYLANVEVIYGIPSVSQLNVLVVSPHPDDESIGSGGTLKLMAEAGASIDAVFLTDGATPEDGSLKKTRRAEAHAAIQLLGMKQALFLDGQDGDLHLQPWLSDEVHRILQAKEYQIVFAPWPYDGMSDHGAAFQIVKKALHDYAKPIEIWLYEVWSPLLANRLVNIDSTVEVKRQAILAHQSQVTQISYSDKIIALNAYRSLACRPAQFAEGFLVCDRKLMRAIPVGKSL